MSSPSIQQIIDEIFSLYEKYGADDYIGEPVSQLEHMTQAAQLAEQDGGDEEVILAAYFHDIGHLYAEAHPEETFSMEGFGAADHEKIGADYLRRMGFSEKITRLVGSHVQAKRYLTFRYPDYYQRLSAASRQTLEFQGGPMKDEEARHFEEDPLFDLMIKMRQWDEQAKLANQPLPSMQQYKILALRHLQHRIHENLLKQHEKNN